MNSWPSVKKKTVAARWDLTDQAVQLLEPIMLRLLEEQRAGCDGLRSAAEVMALRELLKSIFMDHYVQPSKALSDAITGITESARVNAYAEICLHHFGITSIACSITPSLTRNRTSARLPSCA